jgi:hypothetical protein
MTRRSRERVRWRGLEARLSGCLSLLHPPHFLFRSPSSPPALCLSIPSGLQRLKDCEVCELYFSAGLEILSAVFYYAKSCQMPRKNRLTYYRVGAPKSCLFLSVTVIELLSRLCPKRSGYCLHHLLTAGCSTASHEKPSLKKEAFL